MKNSKKLLTFFGIFLAFFCVFFLSSKTALAQSISGTVLVDGAVPTGDLVVEAFDLDDPVYVVGPPFSPGGPPMLKFNQTASVSNVDGSYNLAGLTEGHRYKLVVVDDSDPITAKPTWYGNVSRSGLSDAVTVSGGVTGIDFDIPAADGTYIQGETFNCPAGTDFVGVIIADPDMWVILGSMQGLPNDSYNSLEVGVDLYADEEYRLLFAAVGMETGVTWGLYNNRNWESYECAGLAFGNATGVNHDFAAMRGCDVEENGEEENGTQTTSEDEQTTTTDKKSAELPETGGAGGGLSILASFLSLSIALPVALKKKRFFF